LQTVVLHVHSDAEREAAERVVRALGSTDLHVTIDVLPRDDAHAAGYSYFDARQQQAAAGIAQQLMLAARRAEVTQWVTQLPGAALPASADYGADRVDFVLPPLGEKPNSHFHINPGMLQHMSPATTTTGGTVVN
jgi:hypothetical protein